MPTPRRRPWAEPNQAGPLSIVALAATALVLVVAGGQIAGSTAVRTNAAATWRGLVGEGRAEVAVGQRLIVLLKAPSLADRVAKNGGAASDAAQRVWTQEARASQKALFERLALQGIAIRPEYSYTRVVNGFAAAVDARAIPILERAPEVEGVYPVRPAYPASLSGSLQRGLVSPTSGRRTDLALPGFDGRGVVVALLDTGVDRSHPYLRGRVRPGIDILSRDGSALAEAHPDDAGVLERHGTQMAGLVAGSGGPAGLGGVARGATILPIRVAGWQRDASGRWAVFSRSDQLLAGLDRAVDPNGDGVAHDAARIALVALAEPYDAFATSPTAQAVEGALALDTLVVASAGNDGPAGPSYGSISGPGGAPAALTVGAADVRTQTDELRVVMRAGLDIAYAGIVPLAGAVRPDEPLTLAPGAPVERATRSGDADDPPELADFFDDRGYSRVAGRAALVRGGARPAAAVRRAATAGAAAVLVYGSGLPAGALGLDADIAVPVVGVPDSAARRLLDALDEGASTAVTLSGAHTSPNAAAERVAEFSSRGLAFRGDLKPDLIAPGVGLTTSDAGINEDGSGRFGTVNGTSAAAATVAGAAALLAQARPSLGARALKSLLVGTARPFEGEPMTAQGAGGIDLGAAVASELAAEPASLAVGHVPAGVERTLSLAVRNVSTRALRVRVRGLGVRRGVRISADATTVVVDAGGKQTVELTVRPRGKRTRTVEGTITFAPDGAPPLRVPWVVVVGAPPGRLLQDVAISHPRFRASDDAPSVLTFQAGRVLSLGGADHVYPVERLDVELWTTGTRVRNLGLLARLRNLLPGNYAFGLTGRGPAGAPLRPGRYRLRIVALPTETGRASSRVVPFVIRK